MLHFWFEYTVIHDIGIFVGFLVWSLLSLWFSWFIYCVEIVLRSYKLAITSHHSIVSQSFLFLPFAWLLALMWHCGARLCIAFGASTHSHWRCSGGFTGEIHR